MRGKCTVRVLPREQGTGGPAWSHTTHTHIRCSGRYTGVANSAPRHLTTAAISEYYTQPAINRWQLLFRSQLPVSASTKITPSRFSIVYSAHYDILKLW